MVIIGLRGGLGNQLFQYAAAKQIANYNETELFIDDVTGFHNDPYNRSFSLCDFCIESNKASLDLIKKYKRTNKYVKYLQYKLENILPIGFFNFLVERVFHYDNRIGNLRVKNNIYIEGYFQTEKYFKNISDQIRSEFQFKNKPDNDSIYYLSKIKSTNSISLHVRKYDSTETLDSSPMYGVCSINYYQKAINYIEERIIDPTFFIFSDDIEWAKNKLIFINSKVEYIIRSGNIKDSEDLRLMKNCSHNIIANSSFSWWGAWLNENKDKIVIAPNRWFATEFSNYKDVVPNSWVKL